MYQRNSRRMYIIKRDGRTEDVFLDKITSRIHKLCYSLSDYVEPLNITMKVIQRIYSGITTAQVDSMAAEEAAEMAPIHSDYEVLAGRIAISNLQRETKKNFSEVTELLYNAPEGPLISEDYYKTVKENAQVLDTCLVFDRDFFLDYHGFRLLESQYLLGVNGKTVERPQHLFMRACVALNMPDIEQTIRTYNFLSEKYFMFSNTILMDAGLQDGHLTDSYSLITCEDSIEGIFRCIHECAKVLKCGASMGIGVQNIRGKGSYIAGTNGISNGLMPMLRVINTTATLFEDETSRRNGSVTIYLECWHADIFEVLDLKKSSGKDEVRARDLNYALFLSDLFMQRVESNGLWSLMCPDRCRGLPEAFGDDFTKLYEKYELEKKFVQQIPAQELWKTIISTQIETGMPYILYKNAINQKSNQKNVGTIKTGSFSGEILQFTSGDLTSCCPTASLSLPNFVDSTNGTFNFDLLKNVTKLIVQNLNKVLEKDNFAMTPVKDAANKLKSIGIGVQGLADAFLLMNCQFDSEQAKMLNKQIFETIYFGALEASNELACKFGSYELFNGCPASQGLLQFDLWRATPTSLHNWQDLKDNIVEKGLRNSLLVAITSNNHCAQILGTNDTIEPYYATLQDRYVINNYQVVNCHLKRHLEKQNLWNSTLNELILNSNGSIQQIPGISDHIKDLFKTSWEISQKVLLGMAADRAPFICSSQAINLHVEENITYGALSSMHFYSWRNGLKTGMCNLVRKIESKDDKSSTASLLNGQENDFNMSTLVCSLQNPEGCLMCGA